MNEPSPPPRPTGRPKAKVSWIVGGVGLIIVGVVLLPTVAMTAVGIGVIAVGVLMIGTTLMRASRNVPNRHVR